MTDVDKIERREIVHELQEIIYQHFNNFTVHLKIIQHFLESQPEEIQHNLLHIAWTWYRRRYGDAISKYRASENIIPTSSSALRTLYGQMKDDINLLFNLKDTPLRLTIEEHFRIIWEFIQIYSKADERLILISALLRSNRNGTTK